MTGFEIPLMIAGTGVMAYSSYQQSQIARSQAESAAEQAKAEAAYHAYNAEVSSREAEAEQQATIQELQQHGRQAKQMLARQRALTGKSGVLMEGSPLLVMEDTASQLELEHNLMMEAGSRRAGQWQSQSILDIRKAGMSMTKSRNYMKSAKSYGRMGVLGAGSSLLSGGSSIAYMRSQGSPWLPGSSSSFSQPLYRTH